MSIAISVGRLARAKFARGLSDNLLPWEEGRIPHTVFYHSYSVIAS